MKFLRGREGEIFGREKERERGDGIIREGSMGVGERGEE